MNREELKKLCKEEFFKNIKEYIKSETIFTYVDGLEKENKKYKSVLDKIKDVILYKYPVLDENMDDLKQEIYKLLEEIE